MHWANTLWAGWLSMMLWHVPEPDYLKWSRPDADLWKLAFEQTMRSDVLPNIPGI